MAYRIQYRATQGQQGQGSPGGGYLLDQYRGSWATQASTFGTTAALMNSFQIPQFDTQDFQSSILGDYEPQTFTPHPRVGRVTVAFSISIASVASTSAPVLTLSRQRQEGSNGAGSVSTAVIATFDLSAITASLPWAPYSVSGSLVSNGVLNANDVLTWQVSAASTAVSLPAGNVLIDIEA